MKVYPWQFGYSVGRHVNAGAVELPSYSLRRVLSSAWAYAGTAIGTMEGDALYDHLLDYFPCVYWERHCYYYQYSGSMVSARTLALREFVAVGFRIRRKPSGIKRQPADVVPGDIDVRQVDPYIFFKMEEWEQHLRKRWHQLQDDVGIVTDRESLSLRVRPKGTYYAAMDTLSGSVGGLNI